MKVGSASRHYLFQTFNRDMTRLTLITPSNNNTPFGGVFGRSDVLFLLSISISPRRSLALVLHRSRLRRDLDGCTQGRVSICC